jgi:hypothetical protein
MNLTDRIDLKKLIKQSGNDYEDNTDGIRTLRHSDLIRSDILALEELKKEMSDLKSKKPEEFKFQCQKKCSFLYNSYTDIFNRVFNDELDLELMSKALYTLKQIEEGKINQQEGSVLMGKLFYQIFVDSALKKGEHLEQEEDSHKSPYRQDYTNISYQEFKKKKT